MDKDEFKKFCHNEFKKRGFKKVRSKYFLAGEELLCELYLQRSAYGPIYYVNITYFLGDYRETKDYPKSYYGEEAECRIIVLSKTATNKNGEHFETVLIEYLEYTEDELRPYFDKAFDEVIMPPIIHGKNYILEYLDTKYSIGWKNDALQKWTSDLS